MYSEGKKLKTLIYNKNNKWIKNNQCMKLISEFYSGCKFKIQCTFPQYK